MREFITSSGFVFKIFHRGDMARVISTQCDVPQGTILKVLAFSDLTRTVTARNLTTLKKCVVNSGDLELVSASMEEATNDETPNERDGHLESQGMVPEAQASSTENGE